MLDVKIIDYVPAEAFWPKPKVDSAIIKIVPKEKHPTKNATRIFCGCQSRLLPAQKTINRESNKKIKHTKRGNLVGIQKIGHSGARPSGKFVFGTVGFFSNFSTTQPLEKMTDIQNACLIPIGSKRAFWKIKLSTIYAAKFATREMFLWYNFIGE